MADGGATQHSARDRVKLPSRVKPLAWMLVFIPMFCVWWTALLAMPRWTLHQPPGSTFSVSGDQGTMLDIHEHGYADAWLWPKSLRPKGDFQRVFLFELLDSEGRAKSVVVQRGEYNLEKVQKPFYIHAVDFSWQYAGKSWFVPFVVDRYAHLDYFLTPLPPKGAEGRTNEQLRKLLLVALDAEWAKGGNDVPPPDVRASFVKDCSPRFRKTGSRFLPLAIPHNLIIVGLPLLAAYLFVRCSFAFVRAVKARRAWVIGHVRGKCLVCRYDMRGLANPDGGLTCPEYGTVMPGWPEANGR